MYSNIYQTWVQTEKKKNNQQLIGAPTQGYKKLQLINISGIFFIITYIGKAL